MNLKIIALSNFYYREVALNWVRHIEKLGIENYEIVCVDIPCRKYLQKHGVKTSLYVKKHPLKKIVRSYLGDPDRIIKSTLFRHRKNFPKLLKLYKLLKPVIPLLRLQGYRMFHSIWKLEVVRKYLQDGYDVVLSDTDALWFKDPLEDLVTGNSCDIVASTEHGITSPPRFDEKYGYTLCMGWVAFKNTPGVIRFLDSLLVEAERQKDFSDQRVFNHSLMDRDPDLRSSDLGDIFVTDDIEILALNRNLVWREPPVPGMYVWHPLSHKDPIGKKLACGKHWLL